MQTCETRRQIDTSTSRPAALGDFFWRKVFPPVRESGKVRERERDECFEN